MVRQRFGGAIAGLGCTGGVRIVVGRWTDSPLGVFADVMLAEPSGNRLLLAPSSEVAAPRLTLRFSVGSRAPLGYLLHAVPPRVATAPAWEDVDLGVLAPVDPEPGFGFGSTPRVPSVTTIVTTVETD